MFKEFYRKKENEENKSAEGGIEMNQEEAILILNKYGLDTSNPTSPHNLSISLQTVANLGQEGNWEEVERVQRAYDILLKFGKKENIENVAA